LLLSVRDAQAAGAVRMTWPGPEVKAWLSAITLRPVLTDELASGAAPPVWARDCAARPSALVLAARPRARGVALAAWKAGAAPATPPDWLPLAQALCEPDIEHLELTVSVSNRLFHEQLRCRLSPEARGTFSRLLKALKAQPAAWDRVQTALPGTQDLVLLFQVDLAARKDDTVLALQFLERLVRGERWARTAGEGAAAWSRERFDFLTPMLSGTFGLVGRPSASGEAQGILLAVTRGTLEVPPVRAALTKGLEELGAEFRTQEAAARIGGQAPLAAVAKGRGLLPAPVIGLAEGWLWLCTNTAAYQDLIAAFGPGGQTLAADAALRPQASAVSPGHKIAEGGCPTPPSLYLRMNLKRLLPLLYTSWVLGEGGPRLLGWKVPGEWLPSPGLVKRYAGRYEADLAWEGEAAVVRTRDGSFPGNAFLLVGLIQRAAAGLAEVAERQPGAVRKQLEVLKGGPSEPRPPGSAVRPPAEPRPQGSSVGAPPP
jgi:hypothetical protein